MKRLEKSNVTKKSIGEIVSILKTDEILNLHAMRSVRGGEGSGNELIIIKPPTGGQG